MVEKSELIGKACDGYVAAARRWSRDALLIGTGLLLAATFLVLPYARLWTSVAVHERALADSQRSQSDATAVVEGLGTIDRLREDVDSAMRRAAGRHASKLSERLRQFAKAVRVLRGEEGDTLAFPGANMAEQFAMPARFHGDPSEFLVREFKLTSSDVGLLEHASAQSGEEEHDAAVMVVETVWRASVQSAFQAMARSADEQLAGLKQSARDVLHEIAGPARVLGWRLPTVVELVPADHGIVPPNLASGATAALLGPRAATPADLRTVSGKHVAMTNAANEMSLRLERATASLTDLEFTLANELDAQRALTAELEQQGRRLRDELAEIEKNTAAAREGLSAVVLPFSWLPVGTHDFVLLYPLLFALGFMVLATRFRRISKQRALLLVEMQRNGYSEADCDLLISSPEIGFDFFRLRHVVRRHLATTVTVVFAVSFVWLIWHLHDVNRPLELSQLVVLVAAAACAVAGCVSLLRCAAEESRDPDDPQSFPSVS
ncbi:MAG: hypothetical protein AAF628_15885 [Planctomycetota bacterium]